MNPGVTFRSLAVGLFACVLMAMHVQCVEVLLADGSAAAEHALPFPAMIVFILLSLLGGGLYALTRFRLLTREESFCVLLAMLIATPIMTQGMWHRFLGLLAATPRQSHFEYIDALNDKLWPHGENLLAGRLQPDQDAFRVQGNAAAWEKLELEPGRAVSMPVLRNTHAGETSSLVFELPVTGDSNRGVVPGEPYLVSALVRGEGFSPKTRVFCRVETGGANSQRYTELISSAEETQRSYLHPTGFVRIGGYGVKLPTEGADRVQLAFGLEGAGRLALTDLKLYSVGALEWAYTGRQMVSRAEYEALAAVDRAGLVVKPDRLLSWAGVKHIITGYIPVGAWRQTAVAWSALVLLLCAATFAIAVLMRRHWAESQRYQFPTFQIPWQLLGGAESPESSASARNTENAPRPVREAPALPPIWRNRVMWCGLAITLAWCLMRGWNFYNPKVPDLNINVPLGPYLNDPGWGGMWQITFTVSAVYLAVCLFMELNVLLSLVLGMLLYRALFWAGHSAGWDAMYGYPFRYEQAIGAYLAYAAIVLAVSWRYLRELGQAIIRGHWPGATTEALSPRVAALVLIGSFAGAMLWAYWLEVSIVAILLFFAFLVTVGFVAAKLRAECGTPYGYFTPYNAMLFVGLFGGMTFFGAEAMMLCLIASGFLTVTVFFYIPGLQVELLEFGRRLKIRPRHLVITAVAGVLAGLFIGGWVFLSNSYALGGDSIKYQWSYSQDWFFSSYRQELARATATLLDPAGSATVSEGLKPSTWAYVYGGVGAVILTVVRQAVSGFWFHPIGFILGSSHFIEMVWGSILVAWAVKLVCLKIGGAEFYRRKLVPLAVGILLGAVVSLLIWNGQSAWLHSQGIEHTYGAMP